MIHYIASGSVPVCYIIEGANYGGSGLHLLLGAEVTNWRRMLGANEVS